MAALSPVAAIAAPFVSRARADAMPAAAAPATATLATATPASTSTVPSSVLVLPEAARELELAGGFRIVRAKEAHYGALPFVLEGEGMRFQVDVLRRDPAGLAGAYDSERFSLFVSDGATVLTAPTRVRGARALGAALERRLAAGRDVPALLSFEERQAAHPNAAFGIDRDA